MAHRILLFGHSYVRHLDGHMKRFGFPNLRLNPEIYDCEIVGGIDRADKIVMISDAQERVIQVLGDHPPMDVCVLMLGTNDLSYYETQSPTRIASRLYDLAMVLLQNGVRRVAFVPCFPRVGFYAFRRRSKDSQFLGSQTLEEMEQNFACRAREFNHILLGWANEHRQLDMVVLKGLRSRVEEHLYDGLHLNRQGQTTLMNILRREMNYLCHKAMGDHDNGSTRRPPRRRKRPAYRRRFNKR